MKTKRFICGTLLVIAMLFANSASAQLKTSYFMEGSYFRTELNPALAPTRGYLGLTPYSGFTFGNYSNYNSIEKRLAASCAERIHNVPEDVIIHTVLRQPLAWRVRTAAVANLKETHFWIGDKVAAWMFDFARPQVDTIYGMKEGESPWLLTALMLFLIGPAEEMFWRGYVQRTLSERWSPNAGFLVTTAIYALVHVGSCNFMLTMAALVAGVAWGALYRFYPQRFSAILLSHALWDVAVFIWFPI